MITLSSLLHMRYFCLVIKILNLCGAERKPVFPEINGS